MLLSDKAIRSLARTMGKVKKLKASEYKALKEKSDVSFDEAMQIEAYEEGVKKKRGSTLGYSFDEQPQAIADKIVAFLRDSRRGKLEIPFFCSSEEHAGQIVKGQNEDIEVTIDDNDCLNFKVIKNKKRKADKLYEEAVAVLQEPIPQTQTSLECIEVAPTPKITSYKEAEGPVKKSKHYQSVLMQKIELEHFSVLLDIDTKIMEAIGECKACLKYLCPERLDSGDADCLVLYLQDLHFAAQRLTPVDAEQHILYIEWGLHTHDTGEMRNCILNNIYKGIVKKCKP